MTASVVLVREPGARLAEGIVTHIERTVVDVELALEQWRRYVQAFGDAGWDVRPVPPEPDCPDSVFVEDTVVVWGAVAVVTRPGAPERRPETAAVARVVTEIGLTVLDLAAPATLDGGDVLPVGDMVYVGVGGRTNDAGVTQLRHILEPLGATVVAVPVTRALHLKSCATALPDGTVVGYLPLVDEPGRFADLVAMPEESGAHVVDLGSGRLLVAADCPESCRILTDRGYQPVPVDISEFQKLEGCVTCLSVPIRGRRRTR
jgi:dimethylargininase